YGGRFRAQNSMTEGDGDKAQADRFFDFTTGEASFRTNDYRHFFRRLTVIVVKLFCQFVCLPPFGADQIERVFHQRAFFKKQTESAGWNQAWYRGPLALFGRFFQNGLPAIQLVVLRSFLAPIVQIGLNDAARYHNRRDLGYSQLGQLLESPLKAAASQQRQADMYRNLKRFFDL